MSNKSLLRKKREKHNAELLDAMIKLRLAANLACKALIELTNYVKSVKFPNQKLEPGTSDFQTYKAPICENCKIPCSISGTPLVGSGFNYWTCFKCGYQVKQNGSPLKIYRDGVQISGGEAIVPVKSKGAIPYDNDQYMFQEY